MGEFQVGLTTLELDERKVEVFYPADEAGTADAKPASYETDDPVPPDIIEAFDIPDDFELTFDLDAFREPPASSDGPFPVLVFGHGAGAHRYINSSLMVGIASHGFVVASVDYIEYGMINLINRFLGKEEGDRGDLGQVTKGVIEELENQSADEESILSNAVDSQNIGLAGHSAGGHMFGLADDPEIDTVIGWATSPQIGQTELGEGDTPLMLIAGAEDTIVGAEVSTEAYEQMRTPKRLVVIDEVGHNGFTDTCKQIRDGQDVIQLARDLDFPIPDNLLELGDDGCRKKNLDPATGWQVIQHYTVAQLRDAMGLEVADALDDDSIDLFADATITYKQDLG